MIAVLQREKSWLRWRPWTRECHVTKRKEAAATPRSCRVGTVGGLDRRLRGGDELAAGHVQHGNFSAHRRVAVRSHAGVPWPQAGTYTHASMNRSTIE